MQEFVDEVLDARNNRSLEIVEIAQVDYLPVPTIQSWNILGNVEEYSIDDNQGEFVQSCSLTLAGEETVDVSSYYPENGIIRIRSRLGSDLHPGEIRTIGTFLIDGIEAGTQKDISMQCRSTLKLATLRPYVGKFKRTKAYLDPCGYVTENYWELHQFDPGAAYEYYVFVAANPYVDPADVYITNFGFVDYVKNWCETPTFPIYIDTSGGAPGEDNRVYPGETFEVIFALGQIRASKAWWDSVHPGDSFYVGTNFYANPADPNVEGAGSLHWYKGELQAYTDDYTEEIYGVPIMPIGWGWHDEVYAAEVLKEVLTDCGFQSTDSDDPFFLQHLAYTYLLTNCEKILLNDYGAHYIDYTNSSSIPLPLASGEYLYVGATDRFRQIYLTPDTTQNPPQNYKILWQYCNNLGAVNVWHDLEIVDDETDGYTKEGRIRFSYHGMENQHYTTRGGLSAYYIRGTWHPDNDPINSRGGFVSNISLAFDADIPDMDLKDRDRVSHLQVINTNILPYLPPNYRIHNEPDGSIRSYFVREKEIADYQLTKLENVVIEKNDSETWTTIHYYGRGRFIPNRLAIKDRSGGDTFTLEAAHSAQISSGTWDDAFDDNLSSTNGVEFNYPDMTFVRTLFCTFDFGTPIQLGENARFAMIGKGGIGRWSITALDWETGETVYLTPDAHDFPLEEDEIKSFEENFNLEWVSEIYIWLWGYNPAARTVGFREIGLWGTDLLQGEAILGTTPPFDTVADQELMEKLQERVWQNEEVDERSNTQEVVDYRALQHLSYFLRNIQTIQVNGVRPGVRLHDTVRITIPELELDETYLVEGITRSPNSVISAKLTSYRTDILRPA